MGKEFYLYLFDDEKPHDRSKVCFRWSCEPEEEEGESEMYLALTGVEMYDDRWKRKDDVWKVLGDPKNKARICPRCLWFQSRYKASDFFYDKLNVHHCYSSPVLRSDFYFERLYLGKTDRRYDNKNGPIRVIDDVADIERAFKTVDGLGKPLISKDLEAHEETVRILTKLLDFFRTAHEKGVKKPMILYDGEF